MAPVVVVDQADVIYMQNWAHVAEAFAVVNHIPVKVCFVCVCSGSAPGSEPRPPPPPAYHDGVDCPDAAPRDRLCPRA